MGVEPKRITKSGFKTHSREMLTAVFLPGVVCHPPVFETSRKPAANLRCASSRRFTFCWQVLANSAVAVLLGLKSKGCKQDFALSHRRGIEESP